MGAAALPAALLHCDAAGSAVLSDAAGSAAGSDAAGDAAGSAAALIQGVQAYQVCRQVVFSLPLSPSSSVALGLP